MSIMKPCNFHLIVKPVQEGMITTLDAALYEVVASSSEVYIPGDSIIVENNQVIKVQVHGQEYHFVKEDTILAYIPKS